MKNVAWDVATGVFVIAALLVLARPGSAGPDMISAFTDALSGIVSYAAGGLA
jgi:hypothetical protein